MKNLNFNEIAQKNFDLWDEALRSGNRNTIANLYQEHHIFLPTSSTEARRNRKETGDYFAGFMRKDPTVKIVDQEVEKLAETRYLHFGFYDFLVKEGDEQKTVTVRFTFIWEQGANEKWEIMYHSSTPWPQAK